MSKLDPFSYRDDWRLAVHLANDEPDATGHLTPHNPEEIREHLRDSRKHQNYANYETFTVALVLDNNRDLQETAQSIVRRAFATQDDAELRRPYAADALKAWITDELDMSDKTDADRNYMRVSHIDLQGMAETLLLAALSEVDWLELADEFAPETVAAS
jgi:hypothetical protein